MSKKTKRLQPESIRIWMTPSGAYWASAKVHAGRITKTVRGPESIDVDQAVETLWELV